jgi:uncharacterized membrane protein
VAEGAKAQPSTPGTDGLRPLFPDHEGTEQPSKVAPRVVYQSVNQHTTTVNFNEGLSFPPPDHIHVLEEYAPGFVSGVVQEWTKEMAHRRAFENKHLDLEHGHNMRELKLEDGRIRLLSTVIASLLVLFAVAGVILLFLNRVTAGSVCAAVCAIPGLATVINSLKTRGTKR